MKTIAYKPMREQFCLTSCWFSAAHTWPTQTNSRYTFYKGRWSLCDTEPENYDSADAEKVPGRLNK